MASDKSIAIVGFETRYVYNPETRKHDKPEDYVIYGPRFDVQNTQVVERVSSLDPSRLRDMGSEDQNNMKREFFRYRWEQIEPAYKAWKDGNEIPVHGIAIAMLPSLGKQQADALRASGFKTIEDLAQANDGAIGRIPLPNARSLREEAIQFLEAQKTGAAAAEVAELRAQLNEAVAMISEMQKDKPKRGRPPKSQDEPEAETEDAA